MFKGLKTLLRKLRGQKNYSYSSGHIDTSPENSSEGVRLVSSNMGNMGTTSVYRSTQSLTSAYDESAIQPGRPDKIDDRKQILPVEVVHTICQDIPEFSIEHLDRDIKAVERRRNALTKTRGNTQDEERALLYLRARKFYKRYGHLFNWKTTNDQLLSRLVSEYKLRHVSFGGYSKSVPMEAITEIESFMAACKKIKHNNVELTLIIDDGGKEQRKDPILLAASPFGNWYYVLGAWDKEVEIVDDIIYHHK